MRLGWNTNMVTRPIMCSDLREAINTEVDGIIDKDFYKEALTFIYNRNGKPEAAEGSKDDRVIAQAIKFQLHKWLPSPNGVRDEKKILYKSEYHSGLSPDYV